MRIAVYHSIGLYMLVQNGFQCSTHLHIFIYLALVSSVTSASSNLIFLKCIGFPPELCKRLGKIILNTRSIKYLAVSASPSKLKRDWFIGSDAYSNFTSVRCTMPKGSISMFVYEMRERINKTSYLHPAFLTGFSFCGVDFSAYSNALKLMSTANFENKNRLCHIERVRLV